MHRVGLASVVRLLAIILFLVLLVEGTGVTIEEKGHEAMMRVYFIPFAIETYVPITMTNIEDKSLHAIWFTKEHPLINKLRNLLRLRPAREDIDNRVVRLKVQFVRDTFYVDQEGRVIEENTGKKFRLSKKQLDEIEKSILYFAGVIDIKASKSLRAPK